MSPIEIVLILLVVVFIVFQFRSSRKKRQQQAELQSKMLPGAPVMLTFGLYGTLVELDEEENIARVEIAPGTVIRVHRQTLGRVVEPVAADSATPTTATTGGAETTPTYSLNEDHAISSSEPDFGERIDQPRATRDADTPDA
jgi:preprotein translocase subunit YajC